ncbi:hypothetical protein DSM25559_4805 [Agrobacterium rosae]|uniref:Uncharacterized protein n=1 Tax=Agrobacterium rosae TaxID=1972867 RepID=A0A1R3U941_9HYPH|nr:hypothetical protein DSM25559_4805 [Agrobacterium rosae]
MAGKFVNDIACWCGDWHGGLWGEREGRATRMRQIDIDSLGRGNFHSLQALQLIPRIQSLSEPVWTIKNMLLFTYEQAPHLFSLVNYL